MVAEHEVALQSYCEEKDERGGEREGKQGRERGTYRGTSDKLNGHSE